MEKTQGQTPLAFKGILRTLREKEQRGNMDEMKTTEMNLGNPEESPKPPLMERPKQPLNLMNCLENGSLLKLSNSDMDPIVTRENYLKYLILVSYCRNLESGNIGKEQGTNTVGSYSKRRKSPKRTQKVIKSLILEEELRSQYLRRKNGRRRTPKIIMGNFKNF